MKREKKAKINRIEDEENTASKLYIITLSLQKKEPTTTQNPNNNSEIDLHKTTNEKVTMEWEMYKGEIKIKIKGSADYAMTVESQLNPT